MKRVLAILMAIVFSLSAVLNLSTIGVSAENVNLIGNSGFDTNATGWSLLPVDPTSQVKWVGTEGKTKPGALYVKQGSSATKIARGQVVFDGLDRTKTYTLKYWVKSNSPSQIIVQEISADASKVLLNKTIPVKNSSGWQEVVKTISTAPGSETNIQISNDSANKIVLMLCTTKGNEAYYDDVFFGDVKETNQTNTTVKPTTPVQTEQPKAEAQSNQFEQYYKEIDWKAKEIKQSSVVQATLYASSNAKGTNNSCTKENPGTLKEVQAKVREINKNMTGDIIVYLLGGEYYLENAFELTEKDSGTNGFNVIYTSVDGEKVSFNGGKTFKGNWKTHEGNIRKMDLSGENFKDIRELYIDSNPEKRAMSEETIDVLNVWDDPNTPYTVDGAIVETAKLKKYKKPHHLQYMIRLEWRHCLINVAEISKFDEQKSVIKFSQPETQWINDMGSKNTKFTNGFIFDRIMNAYEEMDTEKEWYYDQEEKMLYCYAKNLDELNEKEISVPKAEKLFTIKGESKQNNAKNIIIQGINFKNATWYYPSEKSYGSSQGTQFPIAEGATVMTADKTKDVPGAVEIEHCKNIRFSKNVFNNIGQCGLYIANDTENIWVEKNTFYDIGGSAISGGSAAHTTIDQPNEGILNYINVSNNRLSRIGIQYYSCPAVNFYYINNSNISNNDISDTSYSGISSGWGWITKHDASKNIKIANNRIENTAQVLLDCGSIYIVGQQPGTLIEGNYLLKHNNGHGAIYTDAGSMHSMIRNNVIAAIAPVAFIINPNMSSYVTAINNYGTNNVAKNLANSANMKIEPIKYYPNENWPQEAQEIIKNAGIKAEKIPQIPSKVIHRSKNPFSKLKAEDANILENATIIRWLDSKIGYTKDGSVAIYKDLEFNGVIPLGIEANVSNLTGSDGKIEIRLDSKDGAKIGEIIVPKHYETHTMPLNAEINVPVGSNLKDICFVFNGTPLNGNLFNFYDFKFMSKKPKPLKELGKNVALTATPTSWGIFSKDHVEQNGIDGKLDTMYAAGGTSYNKDELNKLKWYALDLGAEYELAKIEIVARQDIDQEAARRNLTVIASKDKDYKTFDIIGIREDSPFAYKGTWDINIETAKKYRYIKVLSNRTVNFAEIRVFESATVSQPEFNDIENHWAKADIQEMASAGLIKGKGEGKFDPESSITRAEFLALATRAAGLGVLPYQGMFTDVKADAWYSGVVQAAYDNKIIDENMIANKAFNPTAPITREEMTSIIINTYKLKKQIEIKDINATKFSDTALISKWAVKYVDKATELGIIKGMTETTFAPSQTATRAQSAVILKRLLMQIK